MTVEDPIEFLHRDNQSIVNQREVVGRHAVVRARAAQRPAPGPRRHPGRRDARLRDDRDRRCSRPRPATSSSRRCTRSTPPRRSTASSRCSRRTSRSRSACSWPACSRRSISQRLMPRADGKGRVPAVEVHDQPPPFIRDCIVDKEKTHLIHGAIAAGHVAVRDADVRPVDLRPLPAGARLATKRRCAGRRNVDEFKLRSRASRPPRDTARDQMARHASRTPAAGSPDASRTSRGVEPLIAPSVRRDAYSTALDAARRGASCRRRRSAPRLARRELDARSIDDAVARCATSGALDDAPGRRAPSRAPSAGVKGARPRCASARAPGAWASPTTSPRDGASTRSSADVDERRCSSARSQQAAARPAPAIDDQARVPARSYAVPDRARASRRSRVVGAAATTPDRARPTQRPTPPMP